MDKYKFLSLLQEKLAALPQDEIEGHLSFYGEMIADRMEEGLSEDEAVSAMGSVEEITLQIMTDVLPERMTKEKIRHQRRIKAWKIVLLILGSPIWLSLGIAAAAVMLSLYVSLWAVIISLWAVFCSLTGCSFGSMAAGIVLACTDNILTGIAAIGAGIICAGLSIFMFYGCWAATKGILILTKKSLVWIKNCFTKLY